MEPRQRPGRRVPGWLPWTLIGFAALLLLVSMGAGILALLFAKGDPTLSRRIAAFISSSVGSDSTRLESARIHGSIFGGAVLEQPRLVVVTPDGPVPWLIATRLTAEYDTFELLFSRRRTLRMTIDSPVLPLVHDHRGNLVVPRFGRSKRSPLDKTATRIDIRIRDGTISLDRDGVRFGNIAGNAVALLEPQHTTIRVARVSGVSRMPGRPGSIRAEGVAVVSKGHMRFDPLYIALDRSRIRSAIRGRGGPPVGDDRGGTGGGVDRPRESRPGRGANRRRLCPRQAGGGLRGRGDRDARCSHRGSASQERGSRAPPLVAAAR
ncbi:MAG: hypothetical protein E6K77_10140 [Candidatus Eisenbacteria bacterium]|uniref:Uncharacterized protein n=1 Tax=Eiseniibacteriota bacterium TaxID=2212470 RepID=A0A538TD19_UNCEI|nr:MAG: hypothetical protein E6K77_10140 [Candidatus Eisenbacteria bacterium]